VILLHGSGGLPPRHTRGRAFYADLAAWIRTQRYIAFLVDSFSARQLPYRGAGVTAMRSVDRAFDVLGAVKHLETLPYVQRQKIAVIGWSHGGGAAIAARNRQGRHPELLVSATVAYYPPCRDFSWFSGTTPLLILMGDQDLLTPADDCRPLAQEARRRGQPVELIVYPNATHAFDGESLPTSGLYLGPGIGRGEMVKYNPEAHRDATERTRLFLERYLKR
jgi:dienelactone hydrolase